MSIHWFWKRDGYPGIKSPQILREDCTQFSYDLKNNPKSNFPLLLIPVSAIYIVYFTTKLLERVIYSGYRHFFTFCLLSSTHIYLASALFLHLITLSLSRVLEITHLVFPIILWSYLISLSHELLVLFLILWQCGWGFCPWSSYYTPLIHNYGFNQNLYFVDSQIDYSVQTVPLNSKSLFNY